MSYEKTAHLLLKWLQLLWFLSRKLKFLVCFNLHVAYFQLLQMTGQGVGYLIFFFSKFALQYLPLKKKTFGRKMINSSPMKLRIYFISQYDKSVANLSLMVKKLQVFGFLPTPKDDFLLLY